VSRAGKASSAAADKQRRQKKIAIGGGVLLALLLAVQGPKTLSMLRGSSASAPAAQPAAPAPGPAPAAPAAGAPAAAAAPVPTATSLKELGNFDAPPKAGPAHLVAFNRFAPRDPFVRGSEYRAPGLEVARVRPTRPVRPTANGPWPARGDAYTVVLASVAVGAGRGTAERRALELRLRGLKPVGILVSSQFRSLRPGYFVVYSGVYETRRAAQRALARVRAKAGRSAYTLRVAR
jgi:hypothetical protein